MKTTQIALFCLFVATMSTIGADSQSLPRLFDSEYNTGDNGVLRLTAFLTVCEHMPEADVNEVRQWLRTNEWTKGREAILLMRSGGTFVIRQQKGPKCWIVSVYVDLQHVYVETGKALANGLVEIDSNSLRTVENERIATLLGREIRRSHPEGQKRIKEFAESRRDKDRK